MVCILQTSKIIKFYVKCKVDIFLMWFICFGNKSLRFYFQLFLCKVDNFFIV